MTKVDLITGFLGAGKTTFISHYVKWLRGKNKSFAVIENEFGRAGADSAVLMDMGVAVSELAGGCICCTLKVNFVATLIELSKTFERIIVEPSGIFSMDDFFEVMNAPDVKKCCETGFVITVVDPLSLDGITGDAEVVLSTQLHSTGMVVLSMAERISMNEIRRVCGKITDISNITRENTDNDIIFKTLPWDEFEDEDFFDIENSAPKHAKHKFIPVNHTTIFFTTTVKPERTFSHGEIFGKLDTMMKDDMYGDILRIKGGVLSETGNILWVNATVSGVTVKEIKDGPDFINVIGKGMDRKKITDLLNA